mgnify:CR=1 FL=1
MAGLPGEAGKAEPGNGPRGHAERNAACAMRSNPSRGGRTALACHDHACDSRSMDLSHCTRIVLLCLLAVLGGCALSPAQVRRADESVAATQDRQRDCDRADACALASPYRTLFAHALTATRSGAPVHYAQALERGEEALLLRIHLIRAAQHSIDLQTFIFAKDDAGLLVLDELVAAARRGVRVRVIADQMFSLGDPDLLARLATAHTNFELRLYNPAFDKASTHPLEFAAGLLCCFSSFNQRMHNKLLLIDASIGIAGGRNYENRYFDWDEAFDYLDRDVLVAGPVAAAAMQASFEQFWQHPRTRPLPRLKDVNPRLLDAGVPKTWAPPAFTAPARVAALRARADDVAAIEHAFAAQALRVGRVDYFSDSPDKPLERDTPSGVELTRHIVGLLGAAQREVLLQTPYLVISQRARQVFRNLRKQRKDLRVIVSTNSLAATDAFYVYALSHKYKKRYLKDLHFEIHEFKPFPADAAEMVADYAELAGGSGAGRYRKYGQAPLTSSGVRLGLHAKSIVIDGAVTLIGSHNFDPRSDDYNTESGFIIHDVAFAAQVRAAILRDTEPRNAWTIARRPRARPLARVNSAIADFSAALPLFDFWPFRYATSYDLKPGCEPLRPSDPEFYDCYEPVGDFPGVDLPLKTIYTRIVTAFGAGLAGIL